MTADPRIDAYVDKAAPFARPILSHLRELVAKACPEAEETLKWSSPAWTYRGSILCTMAAFKAHASFNFWRGAEVTGERAEAKEGMGQFGRLTTVGDLPDDAAMAALIRKAAALIDTSEKTPRKLKHPKETLETPDDLARALAASPAAQAVFDGFPPGQRREYVAWITEAKRAETRSKRLAQAVEWIGEGKRRNWKYEAC